MLTAGDAAGRQSKTGMSESPRRSMPAAFKNLRMELTKQIQPAGRFEIKWLRIQYNRPRMF